MIFQSSKMYLDLAPHKKTEAMVVNYQSIAPSNNDSNGGDDDDDHAHIDHAPVPSHKRGILGMAALSFILLTLNVNGLGPHALKVNTLIQKLINRIACHY
jgi:hypothetical protein